MSATASVPDPKHCCTCKGKPKKKGVSDKVQKMIASMSPYQQGLVAKSPSLQARLEKLSDEGWTVQSTDQAGGDTLRGDGNKVIQLGDGYKDTGVLAHEAGHAGYDPGAPPSWEGKTQDQYVDAVVNQDMRDEGAAQFSRGQARADILKDPAVGDIGFGLQSDHPEQEAASRQIWDDYSAGKLSEDEASTKLGDQLRNVPASGAPAGTTYQEYYGNAARSYYTSVNGTGKL